MDGLRSWFAHFRIFSGHFRYTVKLASGGDIFDTHDAAIFSVCEIESNGFRLCVVVYNVE